MPADEHVFNDLCAGVCELEIFFQIIMDNELLNKGGSIIFDNALFYGEPYSEDCNEANMPDGWGVKTCNEFIVNDTRVHRVCLLLSLSLFLSLSLSLCREKDFLDL